MSSQGLTHALSILALLWSRSAPLFLLAPWFVLRVRPSLLLLWLSLAGAGVLMPVTLAAQPVAPSPGLPLAAACACELVRGCVLALGCALPLVVFESIGVLSDALRGALQPTALDAAGPSLLGTLYGRGALVLSLAASAQIGLLRLFVETLQQTALGADLAALSGLRSALFGIVKLMLHAFQLGVGLSASMLIGTLLIAIVLGLLSRVAAAIVAPLAAPTLLPWLGLGLVCLSVSSVLEQVPGVVRLFTRETTRLLGVLH
jgi:type III secretory pathway component EscT